MKRQYRVHSRRYWHAVEHLEDRLVLSASTGAIANSDDDRGAPFVGNLTAGEEYDHDVTKTDTDGDVGQYAAGSSAIAPGPQVVASSPSARPTLSELKTIRVTFADSVDATTFDTTDIVLTGPLGLITVDSVTPIADTDDTRFTIDFPPQTTFGDYELVMGPDVFDLAGNPMNQDQDTVSGEVVEDQFVTRIYLGSPRFSISDAEVVEGDGGTQEMLFTVTRDRDPSEEVSVDFVTINDSATAAGMAGTTSFSRRIVQDSFDIPTAVFPADLDGDGDQDMITSDWNTATVAWHANDGVGNFTMRVIDEHTAGASSVFAIDVDGDGDDDVLAASYYYDEISWHENEGDGHFTQHMIPNTADGPVSISAMDMDNDGDIDVLSASERDGRITWYENGGAENFVEHMINDTLNVPHQAIAADLDSDGDVDVLSASINDDTIAWFENDGAENFTKHVITDTADGAHSVAVIDVDGDGDMDVLSASRNNNTVAWYENDGDESFATHVITDALAGVSWIAVADIDGDGDSDVLAAASFDDIVTWYENDGNGIFTSSVVGVVDGAEYVAVADVDGDSDLDVLSITSVEDVVSWHENSLVNPVAADYQAASGTLTFAAGETEKTISVSVLGDTDIEPDEALHVTISSDILQIIDGKGVGTILNDDQPIVLFEDSFEVSEWNGLWVEDSQNDWFRSTQRATDGARSAEVDGRATDATLTRADATDLTPFTGVELSYWWYIESGLDSGEFLAVDLFNGTWHNDVATLRGNVDQENTWHHETIPIDEAFLTDNFNFRFRAKASWYAEDANVDDVQLIAASLAGPPNQLPVAGDNQYIVAEDTTLDVGAPGVLSDDSDADGDPLTAVLVDGATDGSVTLDASGSFTYVPAPDFHGTDSFTYKAHDGTSDSNVATVTITVSPLNDAPVANDQSVSTVEDISVAIFLTGSDVDGDALTYQMVGGPAHGSLSGTAPHLTYTPTADYYGEDSFSFEVHDGNLVSSSAAVTITVNAINDSPTVTSPIGDIHVDEDAADTVVDLSGTFGDIDAGDSLALSLSSNTNPALVQAVLVGSTLTLDYQGNQYGAGTVTIRATDSGGAYVEDSFTVSVNAVNDAPVAMDDGYTMSQATTLTIPALGILANDQDVDGDTLTATVIDDPTHGLLGLNADGSFTYTPTHGFFGTDSFTYMAHDATADSLAATVLVTVHRVNQLPAAVDDVYSVNEDNPLDVSAASGVLFNDSDVDGDSLTAVVVNGPNDGILTLNADGSFLYTPAANFNGEDRFNYQANDGIGDSNVATVVITVDPVNDAPVAVADAYTVDQETPVAILLNGNDIDDDPLTYAITSGPAHGSLSGAGASWTYTPAADYSGPDSFEFTVHDGTVASTAATVTIDVLAVTRGPNLAHGVADSVGSNWQTVNLGQTYTSMVVIATPNYDSGDAPAVVRIQNAVGNRFEVRVDSAGGGAVGSVDVHYVVVEEGVYDEPGFKLEAVKFNSTVTDENNSWVGESRSYQQSYSAPVVVGQVMTYNDPAWSVFWTAGSSRTSAPTSSALTVGKHVGEAADVSRANETIGYLVLETSTDGSGQIEGQPFVAGLGADTIKGVGNSPGYQYNHTALTNAQTAVISQAAMDGGNGGWAVLYGANPVSATSLNLAIDEDQAKDSERKHTTEQVAYLVFGAPAAALPAEAPTSGQQLLASPTASEDGAPLATLVVEQVFESHDLERHGELSAPWSKPLAGNDRTEYGMNLATERDDKVQAIDLAIETIFPDALVDVNSAV